jgi:cytochrome oxidase Cu insertion factor (SCO1/SenC/PrrC family)
MTRRAVPVWIVPLLVGLGAVGLAVVRQATAALPHLPSYGQVPDFHLTDQLGRAVSRETLAGRTWVADFIFTRCAGQCPMMTAKMQQLAQTLSASSRVTLVSISVDPGWDTPEVLARYAEGAGAEGASWLFLTGEEAAIQRLCQDGFHLAMGEEGPPEEPITHSSRLVLVDRDGAIRGYYEAADARDLAQLRRDAQRLLRHPS